MGGYFPPLEPPLTSEIKKSHREFPLHLNILSKRVKEGVRPGRPPPDYPPFPLPGSFHLRLMKDTPDHVDWHSSHQFANDAGYHKHEEWSQEKN